ncbi:indole-3-glycerol phosphate synthase TrpC [Desmospora profundinema]|uniref:Indole-3-glycerol phosphate synthase n=1 Tax=Desmospora profundinema TaxID=1571184 RepID=A0ABU1IIH5_9BACL|nr:indole-3-glycerol phosphate synthase TrpC [Desmospora profundinema]MDR6224496.1 indole-3-glycerol phosphate synthase [Desmospora profundinema]
MFLDRIAEAKRAEVERLRQQVETAPFPAATGKIRSLAAAVNRAGLAVIAEVKPASPSKGVIREEVDPVKTAQGYEAGGAAAVSVLTDEPFFKGNKESLTRVRQAVNLPVLRKDFILDPLQVEESRFLGADAILLIAAMLTEEELISLRRAARHHGLEVLIEVHGEDELQRALAAEPDVLGINNRNLSTFETDLAVTERLRPRIPAGIPVIGESGVSSPADADRLRSAGVDGILVGEYLMRQSSPRAGVEGLLAGVTI